MATNDAPGVVDARQLSYQLVHYLRRNITYTQKGQTLSLGKVPKGAVLLKPLSGVTVHTVFNNGTTNTIDIGTSADADLYATALAVSAIAFVPLDEAVSNYFAADTELFVTVGGTGTAASTGKATVVIAFVPNNDLGITDV